MSLTFSEAVVAIRTCKRIANDKLLNLYGLYKQATEGDNTQKCPSFLDIKGKAKWNAWKSQEKKTRELCEQQYVTLVTLCLKAENLLPTHTNENLKFNNEAGQGSFFKSTIG